MNDSLISFSIYYILALEMKNRCSEKISDLPKSNSKRQRQNLILTCNLLLCILKQLDSMLEADREIHGGKNGIKLVVVEKYDLVVLLLPDRGIQSKPRKLSGLLRGCSGEESTCQCRRCKRHGFGCTWRRKWQPAPIFLPRTSRGQRCLAGYSPWGHKESDKTGHISHSFSQSFWVVYTSFAMKCRSNQINNF